MWGRSSGWQQDCTGKSLGYAGSKAAASPHCQVSSPKRGSPDYAVVLIILSSDLGFSFNSLLLPCWACAVSMVPVCRADALPSSEAEAAVRNGCASLSSWKQLLTEFGIRAEL